MPRKFKTSKKESKSMSPSQCHKLHTPSSPVVAQTCSWLCKHITYIRRLPIRFWFLFLDTKQTLLCHRSWLTNELRNSSFTIRHKQSYNKGMHWCAHAHMHTNFNHTCMVLLSQPWATLQKIYNKHCYLYLAQSVGNCYKNALIRCLYFK